MELSELQAEMERLHRASYGWALSCCSRQREEAEDVLQNAYLKVLGGKARYDGRSAFKTWLFAVIRRTAADARRKHFLRRLRVMRYEEETRATVDLDAGDAATDADRLAVEQSCRHALAGLPRRQREALQLVFYHDLSVQEAADVMGVGIGSARTHYERGKKALRERLAGQDGIHELEWKR